MPTYIEPTREKPTLKKKKKTREKPIERQLEEELEQNGRRLRRGAGLLLAVPAHVAAKRLPHLELDPADVAPVRLLLVHRLLGPQLIGPCSEAEREAVAATEVAGPVSSQSLERREGAAARLAHELTVRAAAVHLLAAVGDDSQGQREGEGRGRIGLISVLLH